MASRISCTAHIFRHVERPLTSPYLRLHRLSRTVPPRCGSDKHVSGHHPGSTIQRNFASEPAYRPQEFRYISFPNTRKGRKTEREAYEYWASFWKSTNEAKKPLVFKIDDRKLSGSSGLLDVSREGIVFPAGDKRGEKYWRLDHPLSLSERLQRLRTWLYGGSSLPRSARLKIWLYGGSSLPLSAKLQWLVIGPDPRPWSKRSRWIRWPIYGSLYTLLLASIIVWNTKEQVPLTGRWRINLCSDSMFAKSMEVYQKLGVEPLREKFRKVEPLAEPQFSRVNGIIERILLACGLENTVRHLYLVDAQGKRHVASFSSGTLSYVRLNTLEFANAF